MGNPPTPRDPQPSLASPKEAGSLIKAQAEKGSNEKSICWGLQAQSLLSHILDMLVYSQYLA
jgi:hypothetical protein